MFRKLISIFLLLALIGSSFSRYFVIAGFAINKKYIANNLCENRSRPQLHCNGKCVLMKRLNQLSDDEKKQEKQNVLKKIALEQFLDAL